MSDGKLSQKRCRFQSKCRFLIESYHQFQQSNEHKNLGIRKLLLFDLNAVLCQYRHDRNDLHRHVISLFHQKNKINDVEDIKEFDELLKEDYVYWKERAIIEYRTNKRTNDFRAIIAQLDKIEARDELQLELIEKIKTKKRYAERIRELDSEISAYEHRLERLNKERGSMIALQIEENKNNSVQDLENKLKILELETECNREYEELLHDEYRQLDIQIDRDLMKPPVTEICPHGSHCLKLSNEYGVFRIGRNYNIEKCENFHCQSHIVSLKNQRKYDQDVYYDTMEDHRFYEELNYMNKINLILCLGRCCDWLPPDIFPIIYGYCFVMTPQESLRYLKLCRHLNFWINIAEGTLVDVCVTNSKWVAGIVTSIPSRQTGGIGVSTATHVDIFYNLYDSDMIAPLGTYISNEERKHVLSSDILTIE